MFAFEVVMAKTVPVYFYTFFLAYSMITITLVDHGTHVCFFTPDALPDASLPSFGPGFKLTPRVHWLVQRS